MSTAVIVFAKAPVPGLAKSRLAPALGADGAARLAERMLRFTIPRYEREGKAYLTIAIGCTGGRHRSVSIVEELARRLGAVHSITVRHRDLEPAS